MRPTDALPHPAAWRTTTVRRSVELTRGVSWSKEQEHSEPGPDRIPVIGIKNIQDRLELNDLLYLSGLSSGDVEKARVSADWTVIVGSNGNRNRIGNAQLIRNDAGFLFASFLIGAKPKPDSGLKPDYFFRWLSSEQVQSCLSASAEGTTGLSNLSHSFFKSMSIPLPPPEEQAAIARILDAVDTALERTREAAKRAQDHERAVVQRVFTEGLYGEVQQKSSIGHIPRSWQVVPVKCVVENFQYGLSVPMDDRGHLPILRMGSIQKGDVKFSDLKYVNLPDDEVAPYLLNRGDVLFNRTNSQEWVGKVGIFRHSTPAVFAFVPDTRTSNNNKGIPVYLGHVLGTHSAQCRIKRFATPGVQQVNVNATNLGKVLIPLPVGEAGLQEQWRIGALLEAARDLVRSYDPVVAALQALKHSLMHDLLTGKVRVGDVAEALVP